MELAAVGADVAVDRIDLAHVGADELDAAAGEMGAAAADRLRPALAGHHPEVGGREGGLRPAAEDEDDGFRHAVLLSVSLAETRGRASGAAPMDGLTRRPDFSPAP